MDEMNFDESKDLMNNLRLHKKNWDIDDKVNRKVHKTCFAGLLKLEARVTHNMPLLSAIVDCYNEDTRSFRFNEHNFVYSLEDVLYITGLPVDGLAIEHNTEGTYADMCSKYLGKNGCIKDSSEVCFSWLKKHFEKVPEGVEENSPQILPFVRAFLMYILGSVVFPTKSGNKVSVRYLPLLKNMDEVDKYAWGASQLVHLHKSLSDCKKKATTSIAGHTYSLLIFAMEHIPKLALHLTGATLEEHIANLPKSFPLLVGWAKLLEKSANNAWKAKDKAEFKKTLNRIYEGMEGDDEMDEEDGCKIVWQPYKRLGPLDQFLPPYCIGQQKMGMSRTVLICFERFAYHRPDISPKQFGLKEFCLHRPLVELRRLKRWNGRIKDLGKDEMHNTYKQEWDARNDCLICPPDYSTIDGVSSGVKFQPSSSCNSEPVSPIVHNQDWLDAHFSYEPNIDEQEIIRQSMQNKCLGELNICADRCWISSETIIQFGELLGRYFPRCYFSIPIMSFDILKRKKLRWINKFPLPKTQKIFLPILIDSHWMLMVVDIKEECFLWLDSLQLKSKECPNEFAVILNRAFVSGRLGQKDEWLIKYPEDIPTQENLYGINYSFMLDASLRLRETGILDVAFSTPSLGAQKVANRP